MVSRGHAGRRAWPARARSQAAHQRVAAGRRAADMPSRSRGPAQGAGRNYAWLRCRAAIGPITLRHRRVDRPGRRVHRLDRRVGPTRGHTSGGRRRPVGGPLVRCHLGAEPRRLSHPLERAHSCPGRAPGYDDPSPRPASPSSRIRRISARLETCSSATIASTSPSQSRKHRVISSAPRSPAVRIPGCRSMRW